MATKEPKTKRIPPSQSLGGELRAQLKSACQGGEAHTSFEKAVADFPPNLRGDVPQGLPYSAWQVLEHLRIAQHDILDFCQNSAYKPLQWPDEYWPKSPVPPDDHAWEASIRQIKEDRASFERLLDGVDDHRLCLPIPWGEGQNLLREALLVVQHQSYHLAEIVVIRRLLGAWKR